MQMNREREPRNNKINEEVKRQVKYIIITFFWRGEVLYFMVEIQNAIKN